MNEHDMQTLRARLHQFAGGLTPEEGLELRSIPVETAADEHPPALRAKLQALAGLLTREEQTQVHRLVQRAGVGVVRGEEADTTGYRESLYDGAGELNLWKGPPRANPVNQPNRGGGNVVVAAGSELWDRSGIPQILRVLDLYF